MTQTHNAAPAARMTADEREALELEVDQLLAQFQHDCERSVAHEGDITGAKKARAISRNAIRARLLSLDAVTREREKAEHKAALLQRTVDRYLPCPDHRDKINGECYVCALERAQSVTPTDAMVERAAGALYDNPTFDFNRGEAKAVARVALTAALTPEAHDG